MREKSSVSPKKGAPHGGCAALRRSFLLGQPEPGRSVTSANIGPPKVRGKGNKQMPKYSVKKPFTVLVAVILVVVLGFVSLTGMQTDLLPNMNLPYLLVITTYPGASRNRWKAM